MKIKCFVLILIVIAAFLALFPAPAVAEPDNFSAMLTTGGKLFYTYPDNDQTRRGFVKFPAASDTSNLVEVYIFQGGRYIFWVSYWLNLGESVAETYSTPYIAYLGPGRVNVVGTMGKTALLRRLYLPDMVH